MKHFMPILTGLLLLLNFKSSSQQIDYKGFPQWGWQKEGNTEYYLYTPENLLPDRKYPVAVFLHGCCGEDDHATLRNAVDQHEVWAPFIFKGLDQFFLFYAGIIYPHRPMEYRKMGHDHPWVHDVKWENEGAFSIVKPCIHA
ncbi:MAG: hypothetical protein KFF73_02875 [Cyclobacteriaceae bacterium]|nr:hypothetical protein [Cyclobacteriaceae bacterium]